LSAISSSHRSVFVVVHVTNTYTSLETKLETLSVSALYIVSAYMMIPYSMATVAGSPAMR